MLGMSIPFFWKGNLTNKCVTINNINFESGSILLCDMLLLTLTIWSSFPSVAKNPL